MLATQCSYPQRMNTTIGPALAEKAAGLCETKLGDGLGSIFLLAVFCNMMIYIAVEGFNRNPRPCQ